MFFRDTFKRIFKALEKIMATQADAAAQLKAVKEKLDKVAVEENGLQTRIAELIATINAGGSVTPELQAAIDAVVAQAQVLDDITPDAP